jgi:excisionase family DNA binding protein
MDGVKWLTVEEISERLQIHRQTVRRWLREGHLHGVLIGDRAGYRVHPDDLAAFLKARGYTPQPGRQVNAERKN